MTTSQQLEITLASGRSGTGPATWGQQAVWDAVARLSPADAPRYNITTAAPLDPGLPVPVVLGALTDLLHLHDSLHTRLHPDGEGGLRQTVDPAGRLPVHTRHCADEPAELAGAGAALHDELAALPFDAATEWPIRVGLVEAGGRVRHISLVLAHTAVDGAGMARLVMDLTELSLGGTAEEIRARRPAQQPLEEAAFQTSGRGLRRDANARAHALRKLRSGPARIFPPADAAGPAQPFPHAVLNSPALLRAVDVVAEGHRVSSSSVLLAAAAVMTARLAGSSEALLQVIVNNRFLPGLTAAVSVVAGDGLLHLTDAGDEFGTVVRRTHSASIATYRHAYFNKRLLDAEIARLTAETGPPADRSCIFNDTRDLLPPVGATAGPGSDTDTGTGTGTGTLDPARTTLSWPKEFEPRPGLSYALDALQTTDALQLAMTADGSVLPRPKMERFLRGIEELILSEAHGLAGTAPATGS